MRQWHRLFTRPLTTSGFDTYVGQVACWLASAFILVLGFGKLLRMDLMDLTETELLFGILLLLAVSLLGVLIGLVLPLASLAQRMEFHSPKPE